MTNPIKDLLFICPNLVILVPLILAVVHYKGYPRSLKIITWYLTLSVATQIMSFCLWKLKKNNLPILHVYTLLEYCILLQYYATLLRGFVARRVFHVLTVAFAIFAIADACWIEDLFAFNNYSRTIEALVLITLAVCWFIKIAGETEEERAGSGGHNYISSGFLIYFAGAIMLFCYSSYVEKMAIASRINLWTIHSLLAALLYVLLTIGLWKAKTR